MEGHFAPELQAKLDRVAAENSSPPDVYVQQLVKLAKYSDRQLCPRGAKTAPWDRDPCHHILRTSIVEHYLDHDVWLRQKVETSLERLDRGEFLTHEEMGARIDKKFGA